MSTAPPTATQGRSQPIKNTNNLSPTNKPKTAQKKTISQSQLDGSTFRLSKPPKIRSTITPQSETYEKYSTRYFRDHPEEDDDLRDPKEKLMEIDGLITDDTEGDELFNLLVKQKCLRSMIYGESSQQVVNSLVSIGNYYQKTDRPKSAIRHFQNGREIGKATELTGESKAELSVGMAESYFSMKDQGKKNVTSAKSALADATNIDIEKSALKFRRDHLVAQIAHYNHEETACDAYAAAEKTLVDGCLDDDNLETAEFYLEAAQCARECNNVEITNKFAKEAAKRFGQLENTEKQQEAEALVIVQEEEEEHHENPPEDDNQNEENQNQENVDQKELNSKGEEEQQNEEEQKNEERPTSFALSQVIQEKVDDEL